MTATKVAVLLCCKI